MAKYRMIVLVMAIAFIFAPLTHHGHAYAADSWSQKAAFVGVARSYAVGFSIGSKGYIGTGFVEDLSVDPPVIENKKDFWEYDPVADTWTQKADFGGKERNLAVGFAIGTKGYIGTGWDGSAETKDFWEYDPVDNKWTPKADFGGTARYYAVGFSIGTKGYVGTGVTGNDPYNYYEDFWEYDPVDNKWTPKANFGGTARGYAVGFSIGTRGYIGTGYNGSSVYNDFWEYDPDANKWTPKADFGGTARTGAVGFAIGTKGYIGTGVDNSSYRKDFWEYEPSANIWASKVDFGGVARASAVGFAIGAKGYIGTGFNGSAVTKDFWEYSISQSGSLSGSFYVIQNKKGGGAVIYLE